MPLTAPTKFAFRHEIPVADNHAPPILNQWYTVIAEAGGLLLEELMVYQENTEAANKDIEWEITTDGEVYTNTFNAASGQFNYFWKATDPGGVVIGTGDAEHQFGVTTEEAGGAGTQIPIGVFRCHTFRFRYRLTTAAGTAHILAAGLTRCRLERI
jgi:hypothetical protein